MGEATEDGWLDEARDARRKSANNSFTPLGWASNQDVLATEDKKQQEATDDWAARAKLGVYRPGSISWTRETLGLWTAVSSTWFDDVVSWACHNARGPATWLSFEFSAQSILYRGVKRKGTGVSYRVGNSSHESKRW